MTGTAPAVQLRRVAVSDLVANRGNVRDHLDGVAELAASIRANGLLQPLIVNDRAGTLVVTDGHRRLEACRRAQVPHVMALVTTDADARHVTTTMLAAAMHKELKPIEQARAFKTLQGQGVHVPDIARSTGYSTALVRQRLLLLELPAEAQQMVEDERLTIAQAAELAKAVRDRRPGAVRTGRKRRHGHFMPTHPLARAVQRACDHRDDAVVYGGTGCGACWEQAIRHDERHRLAPPTHPEETP